MATLLRLPEVAAGATEAVLSEWLVPERTMFRKGEPVALIETEKATVEIEAEADEMILRALVPNGSQICVGDPIALLGAESERDSDADALLAELGVRANAVEVRSAPERREVPDTVPPAGSAPSAPLPDERRPQPEAPPPGAPTAREPAVADSARLFISPLARKMIRQAGLVPEEIRGSGPNGRIIRRDVEAAAAAAATSAVTEASQSGPVTQAAQPTPAAGHAVQQPAPAAAQPAPVASSGSAYSAIPHSRMRNAIAKRLSLSKQTIPHFYLRRSARLDELLALRARLNAVSPRKITINDLVLRAVAVAYQVVPEANVRWTEEALHQFDTVEIGVAIASQRGLVTPVLRGVERATPASLAEQVRGFAQQADEGTLRQSDLEGGSISVTNLGMYGTEEFAAIINPPQSAILAVGAAIPSAVVLDGQLGVATVMNLTLSVDHRAIDGALAARWMSALVNALEEPLRLLA
jgi:pyruvate dehydrogenase E2 component (dihydrolipoamide acetyltransferase)